MSEQTFEQANKELDEIIQKLDEEMCCNTICSVFSFTPLGLNFIGLIKLQEGELPQFIEPTIQIP